MIYHEKECSIEELSNNYSFIYFASSDFEFSGIKDTNNILMIKSKLETNYLKCLWEDYGYCLPIPNETILDNYNLVLIYKYSKDSLYNKEYIYQALYDLKEQCFDLGINRIALSNDVYEMFGNFIFDIFVSVFCMEDIEILIYTNKCL